MKNILKKLWIGLSIFIFGYVMVSYITTFIYAENSLVKYQYYYAIVFSILYLAATVGVCTSLIIQEIKKIVNPQ